MKYIILLIIPLIATVTGCNKTPKRKLFTKTQTIQTKQQKEIKLSNQDSIGTYIINLKNAMQGTNLYTVFISDSVTNNMVASLRDNDVVYIDEVSTQIIDNRVSFFLKGVDQGTKVRHHELFLFIPQQGEFVEANIREEIASQRFVLTSESYTKLKSKAARQFMQDKIKSLFPNLSVAAPNVKQMTEKNLALY
ncbi:MAG: hypothetical protein NZ455_05605 [Bacteroidia bacterium]|nr:hypothetical protein [Bacteroidia bacterium]MDW8346276.1 hypothetical protein [Bacteroidia bacterium]